jgi:hypothetical protein
MRTRLAVLSFLCLLSPAALRAADDTASIEGKVTYKGKPVPECKVTFHPAKGKPITARTDQTGAYLAKGVPAGTMKVTIESVREVSKDDKKVKVRPLPASYGDPKTTPLQAEVKAGRNALDFELK